MSLFSRTRRAHPAATFVRLKPSVDISFTALVYFGATIFIGVAAINSQTNLLFGVFGLMIGALLVAGYISRFSLRRLEVHRLIPEYLVVGDPSTITYSISNRKRVWPSMSVALGELDGCEGFTHQPYAYVLHIAPCSSTSASVPLLPKRRGVHELDCYQISTSFPFGFVKRAVACHQKDTIVIFPALAQVDPSILLLCHSAEDAGAHMRPRKGGSDEFYGVKEFRVGENPRLIHWRRSARTGDLVVREMTRVSPPRLLLVIDNYRGPDSTISGAEIEKALAMAASMASLGLGRGYPVGLFAWSGGFLHLAPNRGKRQRRDLLTAMARLDVNSEQPLGMLLERASSVAGVGTTIVVLTASPAMAQPRPRRTGRVVTISTQNKDLSRYFTFRDTVEFEHSMPLAQEAPDFHAAQPQLFEDEKDRVTHV